MSAEVQKQATKPEVITHQRIQSVRFVESVPFGGTETTNVSIGLGKCDRIFAARIEADGSAVAIDKQQRADGLVFEREWKDSRDGNKVKLERIFQPWANIRCVSY